MFIAEKGITGIELVAVDLSRDEHRSDAFVGMNPMAQVPVLELDDGRQLAETRAICTYLEGLYPQPNLMGEGFEERAFIEMADRRVELQLFLKVANCIRHTHPGLAPLEQPQFADFGATQGQKMRDTARWLDGELARQEFVAGDRFTIADITAFCTLEFARGLMKFRPGEEGFGHLQAWRDRVAERPSAQVV
jgi:glutathione S-transferase